MIYSENVKHRMQNNFILSNIIKWKNVIPLNRARLYTETGKTESFFMRYIGYEPIYADYSWADRFKS